jgi:hypothetical protein
VSEGAAAPTARGAGARLGELVAALPVAVVVLVLLGIALRLGIWFAYSPAVINLADSGSYVGLAAGELFGDATRTVGYPIFLRAAHAISDQIEFTIALQHLIGIVTALVLYATVRRLGAPTWAGAVAAAAVLLSLDQIFLEHALMNEPLFTLLFVAGLYAAVRALDEPRPIAGALSSRHAWIAAAAASIAFAAWVRAVGVPVIALFVLWFALACPGSWRVRLANAAVSAIVAGAVMLGYFAIHASANGYFGLSEASGWALYSRVAPFADCTRFDPPSGTRALCESTPADSRPGADFYGHEPASPARRLFGEPPAGNQELGEFARRALLAQPLSYLSDLGRDLIRYFHPTFEPQDFSGVGLEVLDVNRRAPGTEEGLAAALNGYYDDDPYEIDGGVETLADLQDVLRVHPKLLLICLLLGGAGILMARERLRWGLFLLLGTSLGMMVVAPATAIWSARYAVPASGPIVAAAAIGAWLLVGWGYGRRRERPTPAATFTARP